MKKLIVLFAAFFIWTGIFSQDCNQTFTGEGTFYGYGGGGNCSFPTPTSPVLTGAMNELQYDGSMTCGACVEVTGNKGSLVIRIEDRCPECQYGDIDLSEEAFPYIDDKINGRVPISWKFVPCPVQGAIKLYFKEGSSQWWTAVQVRNHKYPITRLEYKVDGQWVIVPRLMYNYFVVEYPGMGPGPYDFRITDMYGHVIEENNIPLLVTTEINGKNQFPDCDGSSNVSVTGVSLSEQSFTIASGSTVQLTATVLPSDATNKAVSWISSDATVATVNSVGTVTGVAAGSTIITATTNDGGFTAIATITVNGSALPPPITCDNPTTVSIPFAQNGAGDYCFSTSQSIAHINSWNMDLVEVNGVDFTNAYSSSLPNPIDGKYYIYYRGSYPWSHFEAVNTKSTNAVNNTIALYPNPFSKSVSIDIIQPEKVEGVSVLDQLGRTVLVIDKTQISSSFVFGEDLIAGLYFVKVKSENNVQTFVLNKTK